MAATDGSATPKPPAKATPTLRLSKYGRNYRNNLKRELDKLPEDARQEAIKNVAGRYYKEKVCKHSVRRAVRSLLTICQNPYHDEHKEPLKQLDIGSVISADLEILNQFTQAWPLGQQWQLQQLQPKISKKMPKKTAKKDQVTHDPPDSSLTAKQTETLKISTPTIGKLKSTHSFSSVLSLPSIRAHSWTHCPSTLIAYTVHCSTDVILTFSNR